VDNDADLLGLIAASVSLGLCLAAWARRSIAPRRHLRRMAGAAALLGAAALVLVD
jgi:hypothetical protein